jgi:uncharacterized integral membrane protein
VEWENRCNCAFYNLAECFNFNHNNNILIIILFELSNKNAISNSMKYLFGKYDFPFNIYLLLLFLTFIIEIIINNFLT